MSQPNSRRSNEGSADYDYPYQPGQGNEARQAYAAQRRSARAPGAGPQQTDYYESQSSAPPSQAQSSRSSLALSSVVNISPVYSETLDVTNATTSNPAPSYSSQMYTARASRGTGNPPGYGMTGRGARPYDNRTMYDERDPYQYSQPIQDALAAITDGDRIRRNSLSETDSSGKEDSPTATYRRRVRATRNERQARQRHALDRRQQQANADNQRRMAEQRQIYAQQMGGRGGSRGGSGYATGR